MEEEFAQLEARLRALEVLVAFQFAAQHMQTADPAASIRRLRALLLEPMTGEAIAKDEVAIAARLDSMVSRIAEMQERLPRRLVD